MFEEQKKMFSHAYRAGQIPAIWHKSFRTDIIHPWSVWLAQSRSCFKNRRGRFHIHIEQVRSHIHIGQVRSPLYNLYILHSRYKTPLICSICTIYRRSYWGMERYKRRLHRDSNPIYEASTGAAVCRKDYPTSLTTLTTLTTLTINYQCPSNYTLVVRLD